jgi:hypothetical protein
MNRNEPGICRYSKEKNRRSIVLPLKIYRNEDIALNVLGLQIRIEAKLGKINRFII